MILTKIYEDKSKSKYSGSGHQKHFANILSMDLFLMTNGSNRENGSEMITLMNLWNDSM